MSKRIIGLALLALFSLQSLSQDSFYHHLEFGEFAVGFADTILYDEEIIYNQYDYQGKAPIFSQIWFPIPKDTSQQYLLQGDYSNENIPPELKLVYQELTNHIDASYIEAGLTYDLTTDEPIDFGDLTTKKVLQLVKTIPSKSIRTTLPKALNLPIIVYHHGSQGRSDENSVMAEYFASRGYIFISANYHLPYPNTLFGLLPIELEKESKHNQSTARRVVEFASNLTSNESIFYIGHSWGAQEGWCFLPNSTKVKGFVSMETSIEFKKDSIEIKDKWPLVYESIRTHRDSIPLPILSFATGWNYINFDFFKNNNPDMICASYLEPFTHESYTSIYMMRYFLSDQIPVPDSEVLLTQIDGFHAHLKLISTFFESVQTNTEYNKTEFTRSFKFQ